MCLFLQLTRKETSLAQIESDLTSTRQQYKDAVEENGRLAARIQAMHITSQSETDVLANEVNTTLRSIVNLGMSHSKQNM